jgi:uncharacterized membrane protein YkgB
MNLTQRFLSVAARADRLGVAVTCIGLIVVLLWIGGRKAFPYEADGIVPFVANSPAMGFFLKHDAPAYKAHMNAEGQLMPCTA